MAVEIRVRGHLRLTGMDLAEEKEQILGTSDEIVRLFRKASGRESLGKEEGAVNLGIDTMLKPPPAACNKTGKRIEGSGKASSQGKKLKARMQLFRKRSRKA